MSIKTKAVAFTLIVTAAGATYACPKGEESKRGGSKPEPNAIVQQLAFDDVKSAQVLALMEQHRAQRQESRSSHREMREQHRAEMAALLTEEEFTQFEQLVKSKRGKKCEGGGRAEKV